MGIHYWLRGLLDLLVEQHARVILAVQSMSFTLMVDRVAVVCLEPTGFSRVVAIEEGSLNTNQQISSRGCAGLQSSSGGPWLAW